MSYSIFIMWSGLLLGGFGAAAQTTTQKLQTAFQYFEKDNQLKHAISSLYVIDANTGNVVFDKNSQIGLAPASTQKVITSVTAFELLGNQYRYSTSFAMDSLRNILYIIPSGDPTLGSSRWEITRAEKVLQRIIASLPAKKILSIIADKSGWEQNDIPDGWIWQDLANYYGAKAEQLNWRENQFDILLKSGNKIGDPVQIVSTNPALSGNYSLESMATSAFSGSGDNAYLYFPLSGNTGFIKGTIPVNQNRFLISGALPSGTDQLINELKGTLQVAGLMPTTAIDKPTEGSVEVPYTVFHTENSPPLDSIIYWFNKKSINLYGEALVKTMAAQQGKYASTDSGVALIKAFWKEKGIDPTELNIVDGSGLSPLNRITTHAQVEILKYAKNKTWFTSFYNSLPVYNNMSMKSGTIRNVKGFAGYYTKANGKSYIFSFLVNNYSGSAASLVRKMYVVLDVLK
jgi:serine-type D-Ala-D-Ala carboxypeptidase/endopeptidase (penicillin-binding protein 4)